MSDFLPHLTVGIIWYDVDLVQLRIAAASEHFTGQVEVYASHEELIWLVIQRISAIGVLLGLPLQPAAIVFRLNSG
jgi:hypothetical protein